MKGGGEKREGGLRQNRFHTPDGCLGRWGLQSLTAVPEQESSLIGTTGRSSSHHTHTDMGTDRPHPQPYSYQLLLLSIPLTGVFTLRKEIQLLSAGQQEYSSPLTGPRVVLTASVPRRLATDVRGDSGVLRALRRANDPSACGRRLQ